MVEVLLANTAGADSRELLFYLLKHRFWVAILMMLILSALDELERSICILLAWMTLDSFDI